MQISSDMIKLLHTSEIYDCLLMVSRTIRAKMMINQHAAYRLISFMIRNTAKHGNISSESTEIRWALVRMLGICV